LIAVFLRALAIEVGTVALAIWEERIDPSRW
jgi:hypothetical protein